MYTQQRTTPQFDWADDVDAHLADTNAATAIPNTPSHLTWGTLTHHHHCPHHLQPPRETPGAVSATTTTVSTQLGKPGVQAHPTTQICTHCHLTSIHPYEILTYFKLYGTHTISCKHNQNKSKKNQLYSKNIQAAHCAHSNII